MNNITATQTITVRRDYAIRVPDKFEMSGWHEDLSDRGHLLMTVPDCITGHRQTLNAHLSKEMLEALYKVVWEMLTNWNAEVK